MHGSNRRKVSREDKLIILASILIGSYICVCAIVLLVNIIADIAPSFKRTKYFPVEELEAYEPPVIFLESKDGEKYFISLDAPENRHALGKDFRFYDYNPAAKTFLYRSSDAIYEYDLKDDKSKCIMEKDSACSHLKLPSDTWFGDAYYYFDKGKISFVCGEHLIIYDVDNEEFIYDTPTIPEERNICGWLTPQTVIAYDSEDGAIDIAKVKSYEYNVYTDEKTEIPELLGTFIQLSQDKSMGCSVWEICDGFLYNPVLIWDTQNYETRQPGPGVIGGGVYISNDNKYVMFVRNRYGKDRASELLCIRVEDESICEVYTTKDRITDVFWR